MSVIIFLIILAILVLVHEFGHFIVAKKSGIRVDEFGLGFPPRIFGWKPKNSETTYSLNIIPFGGFVKIFGENPDKDSIEGHDSKRSMVHKPKYIQVAVLLAGIIFNIIFAWLLISFGFMMGLPSSLAGDQGQVIENSHVVVTSILATSPAGHANFKIGDKILFVSAGVQSAKNPHPDVIQGDQVTISNVQKIIADHQNDTLLFLDQRGNQNISVSVVPAKGIVPGKKAIGISMDNIGTLKLPFFKALWKGAFLTYDLTKLTAISIVQFIYHAIIGKADFTQVTGPVGIAGIVGDAQQLGFIYLLSFTAFISINLAVLNLIPFPALDGGRVLFVLIESLKRSPIKPQIANAINTIGFALLILLMIVVTYHDILRLF
jgi:regulator of sigma E protease